MAKCGTLPQFIYKQHCINSDQAINVTFEEPHQDDQDVQEAGGHLKDTLSEEQAIDKCEDEPEYDEGSNEDDGPNSRGTAILISNKANCAVLSIPDPQGCFIISKVQVDDKVYVLVNIYAPNNGKDSLQFFSKLYALLQTENLDSKENIILGGDFNCPINPILDKRVGIMIPRKSVVDSIESLQNELDFVDIWRVKNPQTKSYTWSQNSPIILCRLDFWLISNISVILLTLPILSLP